MLYNVFMKKRVIISDDKILGGKPIIAGTRISVELIVNFLAAGMSVKEILTEYPELKEFEIAAAMEYTIRLVSNTRVASTDIDNVGSIATFHEITR